MDRKRYDEIIDKIFFVDNKYFKSNIRKLILNKNKYINIKSYIHKRYDDSDSIRETLYRIHYNIEYKPICKICGKKMTFRGKNGVIYPIYCSNKCKGKDLDFHNKIYNTSVKIYGEGNSTNHIKYVKTCKKKYGYENVFQIPEIVENIKQSNKEKNYGLEKQKETNNIKYGVNYYLQTNDFKEKSKATSLLKYNVEHPMKSNVVKNKLNYYDISNKGIITKKKNNTLNTSTPEDESYILLKEKHSDVIRQYRSKEYPFNCDFYIPSIDTYIECNYHWTHGKKPYNKNDIDCINLVNTWKEKNTKYYDNAIKTYTIRDTKKRNIAKENKINWIEMFNINELKEWIDKN